LALGSSKTSILDISTSPEAVAAQVLDNSFVSSGLLRILYKSQTDIGEIFILIHSCFIVDFM